MFTGTHHTVALYPLILRFIVLYVFPEKNRPFTLAGFYVFAVGHIYVTLKNAQAQQSGTV